MATATSSTMSNPSQRKPEGWKLTHAFFTIDERRAPWRPLDSVPNNPCRATLTHTGEMDLMDRRAAGWTLLASSTIALVVSAMMVVMLAP